MFKKLIEKFQKQGRIKKQKVGPVQLEALLKEAMLDLKEAKKVVNIGDRATYLLAYMAMLKAGRALLFLNGYMPCDGAQHKTVVELSGAILGVKYKSLTDQFENMRRKRNDLTYEAGVLLSGAEAQQALYGAISLVREVLGKVKSLNPQLELGFDLD